MKTAVPLCIAFVLLAGVLAGCTKLTPTGSTATSAPSATTSLHVDFAGRRPTADASVPFDPTARPADPYYKEKGVSHPSYTAFDQLVQWATASSTTLAVDHFTFGFCLSKVEDIPAKPGCKPGADAYWSLSINGALWNGSMDSAALQANDKVSWTLTPLAPMPSPAAAPETPASPVASSPPLAAPKSVVTRDARAVINGTAPAGVRLSYLAEAAEGPGAFERKGDAWTLRIPVAAGRTNVTVMADDGKAVRAAVVQVTRLVQGTVQVDFKGVPGHADRDDKVWIDVDGFASAPAYQGQAVPHPGVANIHDLLVVWTEATGIPIVYKPHNTFGQQVIQIDGVGDPTVNSSAFWCYELNGASATLGITAQEFHPGDVVSWALGCL